nr:roadblock/LC7 domain-containing protein [Candidatus Njordarchaeota archaeon]
GVGRCMSSKLDPEKIKDTLKEVSAHTADIEGAALISYDGMMIANALHADSSSDMVAAMTATLLNLGKLSVDMLQRGAVEQVFIKCQNGYIVIGKAGEHSVITLLARREAKIGILINEINRAAETLLKMEDEAKKAAQIKKK